MFKINVWTKTAITLDCLIPTCSILRYFTAFVVSICLGRKICRRTFLFWCLTSSRSYSLAVFDSTRSEISRFQIAKMREKTTISISSIHVTILCRFHHANKKISAIFTLRLSLKHTPSSLPSLALCHLFSLQKISPFPGPWAIYLVPTSDSFEVCLYPEVTVKPACKNLVVYEPAGRNLPLAQTPPKI